MKHMSLKEIAAACGGTYFGDEAVLSLEVSGVAIDSRKVEVGFLFIPIKGARVDGHDFIPQVMEKGALCTLSEKELPNASHPYILVGSCQDAMKAIARHYRTALGIKVVGITGSVGKTSTKEMIASVLSQKYNVLKTAGNFNNEIGLPLTIFNIREEHEVAVLEMGINHFGEMHRLTKMAQPDVCVITNIGLCHLENLGDRDGILKAKTEMFDYMQPDAKIILNGDDDKLSTVKEVKGQIPKFFGLSTEHDAFATNIHSLSLKGIGCTLHLEDKSVPSVCVKTCENPYKETICLDVVIPIPGEHMVYNALAGALVGQELGLTAAEIKAGIEALTPVSGRNNLIETDSFLIIDDCYNANPVSMKASLDVLALADTRKVAVMGDMFELGADEKELHADCGRYAAEKKIDVLVCIGELSKNTADAALKADADNVRKIYHFANKIDFFLKAKTIFQKGDTVLVKASHGMEFPEIVEYLKTI